MNPEKLTRSSQEAMQTAHSEAERYGHPNLEPEHLLIQLLIQDGGIAKRVLSKIGVNLADLSEELSLRVDKFPSATGSSARVGMSTRFMKMYQSAEEMAKSLDDSFISSEHFFLSSLNEKSLDLVNLFSKFKLNADQFREVLMQLRGNQNVVDDNPESKFDTLNKYARDLTELAEQGKLDPVIGRDDEIRRVIQVLARRTKNNPILIGEPGVGKTAIAEGLAVRIIKQDVPEVLAGKKLMSLDMGALIAGAKYRGEFEDRLKSVIKEVSSSDGEIILFIDEIHTLVGAGKSEGAMDAGQILKPALARGELRCIGATTLDEHKKYIEKDKALERRFQTVMVDEPSIEDAITILRGLKEKYEVHHGVRIMDSALVSAVKLSHRYISSRFLPDKAIDLIDEAASHLSIEVHSTPASIDEIQRKTTQLQVEKEALRNESRSESKDRVAEIDLELKDLSEKLSVLKNQWNRERGEIDSVKGLKKEIDLLRLDLERAEREGALEAAAELKYGRLPAMEKQLLDNQERLDEASVEGRMLKEEVSPEEIAGIVAKWTGIPVQKMLESDSARLLELEKLLGQRVVGQEKALGVVADAIRRARAEISDPNRPIGSFIFLGPTGVGKTETVKALADFLFDSEESIVRMDMSEYMEKHSVARLIGAPPGYVGYEEGGQLTERVRRKPYSVILLDEIEKAHPDVFNVLLQVLDEGRLTDGQGRSVDFRNTVLIMTSNLGATHLLEEGVSDETQEEKVLSEVKSHFRPEFINRVDDFLVFKKLGEEQIVSIVDIQMRDVVHRLEDKKIKVKVTGAAKEILAKRGYDPQYGARPLKRVILNQVLNPVAKMLLSGEIKPEGELTIDGNDLGLDFKVSE